METKLTIKCDIIDAQKILYSASKIIREGERSRDQERLDAVNRMKNQSMQDFLLEPDEDLLKKAKVYPAPYEPVDYGNNLDVYKFMALDDKDKVKYYCVDEYDNEFNIQLFNRDINDMHCDVCGVGIHVERTSLIGTPDTREPKFCYIHYIQINTDSKFVKIGGTNA